MLVYAQYVSATVSICYLCRQEKMYRKLHNLEHAYSMCCFVYHLVVSHGSASHIIWDALHDYGGLNGNIHPTWKKPWMWLTLTFLTILI